MKVLLGFAVACATIVLHAQAQDEPTAIEIREWKVPYESSRPRDPFAADADSVWFVGQRTGYIAHLDVESGSIVKTDLKDGSGPHNLIVGSDGIVWYAGNRTSLIGRYDPKTEEIEEIAMPDPKARDPHTLVFDADEKNIFFTLQGANMLGRMNIETRKVDLVPSKTERSRPYGIKLAPDGSVWAVLLGTHKLVHMDQETLALTEIDIPRLDARPRRLEVLADGTVWYVDYSRGYLGRYDPAMNSFAEWQLPQGENARPYGMASDDEGRVYMVATGVQPNVFVGFDPEASEFFGATEIPSGGGTVRHMHYYAPTGDVWFGTDTNYIGRARVQPEKTEPTG